MMTSAAHHDPYSGMAILPNGAPIPPHPAAAAAAAAGAAAAAANPYLHSHHPGLIDATAMQHQVTNPNPLPDILTPLPKLTYTLLGLSMRPWVRIPPRTEFFVCET